MNKKTLTSWESIMSPPMSAISLRQMKLILCVYMDINLRSPLCVKKPKKKKKNKTKGITQWIRTGSNITLRDLATLNPKRDKEIDTASASSMDDEPIAAQQSILRDGLCFCFAVNEIKLYMYIYIYVYIYTIRFVLQCNILKKTGMQLNTSAKPSPQAAPVEAADMVLPDITLLMSMQRERSTHEKNVKESRDFPTEETNGEEKKKQKKIQLQPFLLYTYILYNQTTHKRNNFEEKRQHVWEEHKGDADWEDVRGRDNRANTWQLRYAGHKEEQKIVEEALKRARQEKLEHAVKFLVSQGGKFSDLKFIAQFLYVNDTLDKFAVGDFISCRKSSVFTESQHRDLLLVYVGLLNFTGMSFDPAFRHFLTDCGFRLPPEGQQIDRLIVGFAHAFTRDNPHMFVSQDQCLILAYAVLMLNTELHNPKAKTASSNGPMTQAQFANILRNDEGPFC
ncbi:ArfGEF [Reticulomyxa filosa]|uniref:ArfGEF n=1 Tax=Reticulomyxa filosa TaxID=46433 RepID=X6NZ48_RETFI|nr:ArfGEF [Reticulomyxa filosa]|eukprot:ETO31158.1 ArfGEF [Reticulomyxa filosa]